MACPGKWKHGPKFLPVCPSDRFILIATPNLRKVSMALFPHPTWGNNIPTKEERDDAPHGPLRAASRPPTPGRRLQRLPRDAQGAEAQLRGRQPRRQLAEGDGHAGGASGVQVLGLKNRRSKLKMGLDWFRSVMGLEFGFWLGFLWSGLDSFGFCWISLDWCLRSHSCCSRWHAGTRCLRCLSVGCVVLVFFCF